MTERVKIKCDDCKFVEDCVDYGWQDCKKFTPKPREPMTKLCDTCEYLKFCARSGIEDVGCDRYKRDTTTNEEWLRQASTKELADVIFRICERATWDYNVKIMVGEKRKDLIVEWLKQPHI